MVVLISEVKPTKEFSIALPLLLALRKPLNFLMFAHRNHGDIAYGSFFSKKIVFLRQPEHIEACFALEAKGLLNRDFLYPAKHSIFGDGLLNSKSDRWEKQRRILQPLFAKEAINRWRDIIIEEATITIEGLLNRNDDSVNLSREIKSLIHRIFVSVLLGRSNPLAENSENLIHDVETISQGLLAQLISEITSNGKLMWLMPRKRTRYQTAVKRLRTFIGNQIDNKHYGLDNNLLSSIIESSDNKTGYSMSRDLIIDEAVSLFIAGQDTTINALLWFFYLLGKHPLIHKQVTEEIATSNSDYFASENLANLSYTKAVLNEVLRLYPPVPGICLQAMEELEIDGYPIKKGSIVIINLYATHHHPEIWSRPNEFYPNHFLNQQAGNRHKYAFFPFGGGLHNCIGRHFAEMEMMIVIVTLLREFIFETQNTVKEAASITLKPDRDIQVSISPLQGAV